MAKYKCIVEYEYPVDHKPPVKAEIILHGDSVTSNNVTPFTDRPHGEWIEREVRNIFGETMKAYECSICKRKNIGDVWIMMELPFCPNCGSDNRKKEGESN